MIKQISSKFILSLFLLVISVFITSSCYATGVEVDTDYTFAITEEQINNLLIENGYEEFISGRKILHGKSGMTNYVNIILTSNVAYIKQHETSDNAFVCYDSDNNTVIVNNLRMSINSDGSLKSISTSNTYNNITLTGSSIIIHYSEIDIYDNDGNLVYDAEDVISSDFNYTLKGVKRGTVELKIEDFDFDKYTIWGFVDSDLLFNVGERLDSSQYKDKMRLFGINSNHNSCYLYHGEKLCYYVIDNETELITSCGYINELAEGNFLYGFGNKSNTEVDFVFLRDGKEYWDNSLMFKTSLNGSELDDNYNDIVTIGPSSYFKVPTNIYSCEYIGFVYDNENNLLSNAIVNVFQDRSTDIKFDSVISWYTEDKQALNEYEWGIGTIKLSGKNSDGTIIDFTNYKIKWSIPNNLKINYIIFNDNAKYDKYVGEIVINKSKFLLDLFYVEDFLLTIDIYSKDYVGPFDITFELYNPDGEFVCNYILNSDDIVAEEVEEQKNNVNKEDFNIINNPNYTGGSSNNNGSNTGLNNGLNINDIQNWGADDYTKLMSTDNFVWEFFKAILGNLPWWITTPLTILIFGVVIITLIRFARGA